MSELERTPKRQSLSALMTSLGKKTRIEEAKKIGQLHGIAMKREVTGTVAAVETRRNAQGLKPLVIEGMKFIGFEVLLLSEVFDKLEVDERYQRGEQKQIVNGMTMALKAGGGVLAPIVLARRKWRDDYTKPGIKYHIVDGQQRVLAHLGAGIDEINCMIFESDSLEAEMDAFSICNATSRAVSGNAIVRSKGGPACSFIRECDADADHALHNRIQWLSGGNTSLTGNIGALMALKGVAYATKTITTGSRGSLIPAVLIPRMDAKFDKKRADAYLRILAKCVRPGGIAERAVQSFVLGLGQVCAEKWERFGFNPSNAPTPAQCASLARVDWQAVSKNNRSLDMLPVVRERIVRIWK